MKRAAGLVMLSWVAGAALAACGSGGDDDSAGTADAARVDAARADAAGADASSCAQTQCGAECVDTNTNPAHCTACFAACTPSADCDNGCVCPTVGFPQPFTSFLDMMDTQEIAPDVLGIGPFSDSGTLHALVVGFDPASPIGQPQALVGVGAVPFVSVGVEVDIATQSFRSVFQSVEGSVTLTRRCAEGVAGSLSGVRVVEIDVTVEPPVVFDPGCEFTIPDLDFDFGAACP